MFPYAEKSADLVQEKVHTETPDDDWVINVPVGDRGSVTSASHELSSKDEGLVATTSEVAEAEVAETDSAAVSADHEKQSNESTRKEKGAETEIAAELGRGRREKVPSVKLRDYVSYNAQHLRDSHHVPAALSSNSESSLTVQGNTPYPLANYISDERFSPDHKAFLAAITSERDQEASRRQCSKKSGATP